MDRDARALDQHALLPRLLHGVEEADASMRLLAHTLPAPLVPSLDAWQTETPTWPLVRLDADLVPRDAGDQERILAHLLLRIPVGRMAEVMTTARRLGALAPAGVILDLTPMTDPVPFGTSAWHPRQREELAELRAAVDRPVWIDGIVSPGDAEIAAEAGLDGVILRSAAGQHVAGPAAAEVLPEVLDTVAGMLGVYVAGPVRGGLDVFRYLALGAEAVLPDPGNETQRLAGELRAVMQLTGCATLEDVGYEAIFAPLWEELG